MPTSFFGGAFFGGEFFSAPTGEQPFKGGRGDNKGGARKRGEGIFKPTGLAPRKKLTARSGEDAQKRLDQSAEVAAEVAGQMAREMEAERLTRERREFTAQEVAREIAALLHKKIRTEEDEIMLLLLMAAAAA